MNTYTNKGVTVWDAGGYDLTTMGDGADALRLLNFACAALEMLNLTYWIDAGTLLGIVRDGHLIPHDTDLDVGCLIQEGGEEKLLQAMLLAGFARVRRQSYKDTHATIPSQSLFMHRDTGILFDVYWFYASDNGDQVELINHNECGTLTIPFDLIYPTRPFNLLGNSRFYSYPAEPRAYLEHRFGPDWKTPTDDKKCWYSEAANLK